MKQITHYQKVMWGLYCEYSYIPSEVYFKWSLFYGKYVRHGRTSKEQWDFINSKYYYITKVDPIYSGTLQDFREYLEYRTWGGKHRRSPYDYKKSNHGSRCRYYSWRYGCHENSSSYRRKPHHKKKHLSEDEIRKREWKKKKKKDPRDQDHKRNYYGNKKPYVKSGNRAERRAMKSKLKSGEFHAHYAKLCGTNGIYKYHVPSDWDNFLGRKKREWVNPWDWD